VSRPAETRIDGDWRELPFREAFLACLSKPRAVPARTLGRWIHDDLASKGHLIEHPTDPRALLRALKQDLSVVGTVLSEIMRADPAGLDEPDVELIEASRIFHLEMRDLVSRMDALLEGRCAAGSASHASEVGS
jgi:hypothetical protein